MTLILSSKQKINLSSDLTISGKNYRKLLGWLTGRLKLAGERRDQYIDLFRVIDREYYGYLLRDQDDAKRNRDNALGKGLKPTDEKLSLIFAQLDEAVTFLLTVLAPDEAIYTAQAPADQQKVASGFAALMNKHAEFYHHYRHLALFLQGALRYNIGAFGVSWEESFGNVIRKEKNTAGVRETIRTKVFMGNALTAFDVYNLLLDPTVDPVDVPEKGQFYSYVERTTPFRLRKAAADMDFHNVEDFLNSQQRQFLYYQEHPVTRNDFGTGDANYSTDWAAIFAATEETKDIAEFREHNDMYAWIIPSEFGLSKEDNHQIWRFQIGSDTHIFNAQPMINSHGMLPINIAVPFEDHFQMDAKGAAERLIPHQRFASFVLNTHQRAVRKKLYGLTIYDAQKIPLLDITDIDMAGGKIAATGAGLDLDLRKAIVQFNDGPDTTRSLENIEAMNNLMQDVLPTNMLRQVAGLERATQYQAASVVQSANRRNLKTAKIITSQAMDRARYQQMQNIFMFQEETNIIDENGKLVEINPVDFLDADIEFTMADGLKGLDRLALTLNMKDLFNSVLQSAQATSQMDVVAFIDWMSTQFGDNTDLSQFKIESPIDALPPEQKALAFQLLQAATQQAAGGGPAGAAPAPAGGIA